MPAEPLVKRAVAFVDGQNLFHSARESFGYYYPNYDVLALAKAVCRKEGWELVQARFYTGVPDPADACLDRRDYRPKMPSGQGGSS